MIYTGGRIIHTTGGRSGNSSPAGGSAPVFSLEFIGIPILYIIIGIIVLIGIIAGVMLL